LNNNFAIITGKIHRGPHKGKYFVCIDFDNKPGVDEFLSCFGETKSLEELGQKTVVVQHEDAKGERAHIYFITEIPLGKKSGIRAIDKDGKIPAIEVKSDSSTYVVCPPSIHQNGYPYQIIGTKEIQVLNVGKTRGLEDALNRIYDKHEGHLENDKENKVPIETLFGEDYRVYEGNNRHEDLMRTMESLIQRNRGILSEDETKSYAHSWNQKHCSPPLDDKEFEKQWLCAKRFIGKNSITGQKKKGRPEADNKEPQKSSNETLMEIAIENTKKLFRDQYGEGFAYAFVKDHCEVISLSGSKFRKFLSNMYYATQGKVLNPETLNNVVNTLQANAELGDTQHSLFLRVAWHEGDLYYDLTNEKHQCIWISKNGSWQVLDQTPVPLFRRYNQNPQDLPFKEPLSEKEDALETFVSRFTNIKDDEAKLVVKVALISWFIPNIPHPILIVHGGKGSAKSMFQTMVKSIVDPAKPSLLTIHNDKSEFIQQIAHNYLAAYDNLKYNPKWLSDEACKTITGIGQTKRVLYTVDEDKIFEYKHCLMFNGINVAFSEPDVIDRSIVIELPMIREDDRKTENEILEGFHNLRPRILGQVFDILAKAITIKKDVRIKAIPRMADYAMWGEAIARAMGHAENEFLDAYYNNIRFQNAEVIESNPVAFAIKKLVEDTLADTVKVKPGSDKALFNGTPAELLDRLDKIANENKINTIQKEWPKDKKWLVRRIKEIRQNLQQELGIEIRIERDSNNTSTVKIEKNVSGVSGEHKMTPENESLTPYLEKMSPGNANLSPEKDRMSPDIQDDMSIKSNSSGDNGDTGDISCISIEESDETIDVTGTPRSDIDRMIGFREPFWYCKQHPNVQNIHREEIEHHIQYSKEHAGN
jgi:hypothetical protein